MRNLHEWHDLRDLHDLQERNLLLCSHGSRFAVFEPRYTHGILFVGNPGELTVNHLNHRGLSGYHGYTKETDRWIIDSNVHDLQSIEESGVGKSQRQHSFSCMLEEGERQLARGS